MKLLIWTPSFYLSKEPPVVPLWFKLHGLPIPYFKFNALLNIRSALGRPLKVDAHTYNKARPALARIFIERDITLPEINRVWIGSEQDGFWQEVILEQRPYYCQHYKMFGHTIDRCYRLHPPVKRKQSSLKEISPIQLLEVNEDGLQDEAQNSPTPFISITPPSPPKEVLREEPNIITIISPTVDSFEERLQEPIQEQQLHHVIEGEKVADLNHLLGEDWVMQTSKRKKKQTTEAQRLQREAASICNIVKTTFIYAGIFANDKALLWQQIQHLKSILMDLGSLVETFTNIRNTVLVELPHQGPLDTWRRGKLFKRIDRFLVNQAWLDTNFMTTISHLPYTCSDHRPLLISISPNIVAPLPRFRFFNVWVEHPEFISFIKSVWVPVSSFPPWIKLWQIQKKVAKLLKAWNWNCIGNLTAKVEEAEAAVKQTELSIQMGLSDEQNLILANANLLQVIHWEEEFYKQKATIKKFVDGDRNTKSYHACIKQRRHSNTILKIKNHNRIWVQGTDLIYRDPIDHFQNLLSKPHEATLLNFDPSLLNDKFSDIHCLHLTFIPTEEEIWKALCSIDGDKVAGADGFTSTFYIKTWEVIKFNVVEAVQAFFRGEDMPHYFAQSTITLIIKGDQKSN
ncbi:uncharacterized protein LOC110037794 [Phalaenopsis equestris]|uniref:uncharacterized protein LOC110037794 n=1 Tax=Phalaenopsis equestris TaxID=78828 RepID=UPI0009E3F183|nr:uncharacterized protein LOC110037794 [Phalaenopsis equestris]